ncbi:hypothetical protein SERLA73DRAFT_126376 [Serpula lacrymans var. lacrymans S7.3]|uniref:DUF833-domain-containing protein n=1 Tax=Serpula lacrymans var. lacrymans (strain S7.3) TaxID=936435 RepID=F8QCW8_SERL3|nr:hypothetical protein SERLA73DRAFT_126376 [Serpula lacrymans var. lacrymans S7.3]
MCVALWTLEHPDYSLILCTNRDEYLSRPTKEAHFHSFGHTSSSISRGEGAILSGIDVLAGGTWLGLSRTGKIAVLTNITEPLAKFTSSRGHLVSSFLTSDSPKHLQDVVGEIIPTDAKFAGFNLLLLSPAPSTSSNQRPLSFDGTYVTNRGAGGFITSHALSSSQRHCGGMSNGIEDKGANEWPKVQHGIRSLKAILETSMPDRTEDQFTEELFDLLTWTSPEAPRQRSELRNTIQVNPLPIVSNPTASIGHRDLYGTRLSTVILVKRDGQVLFVERDRWKQDAEKKVTLSDPQSQRVFRFDLPVN